MSKLAGKIALVTGGNGGLGLATAKRFVTEGATVYITGRRQKELDSAVREIGDGVVAIQGDIANLADLDRMFATIRERSGRLDILFANAGIGEFVPLGQITEEHFDRIFGVNVRGTVFTVQKALPLMRDGGAIVINGSMVSVKGMAAFSVYAATKAALRSFARTWSVDLKGRGIRINVVSPGTVITPGYSSLGDAQIDQIKQGVAATTPLGRVGTPEEIANAVVFLASDESSYMTGADLFVDGGAAQV
jgi:NAD(P)-dependent dehydrogenase (short-subunit alcohol dehydrogenase family)